MKHQTLCYSEFQEERDSMPKTKPVNNDKMTFGQRLAMIRKAKGLSQKELGQAVGLSNRMIAYYEGQTSHPPTHLLPAFAQALKSSTDELLGVKKIFVREEKSTRKLWKRVQQIEKLKTHQQKTLIKTIDTFLKGAVA